MAINMSTTVKVNLTPELSEIKSNIESAVETFNAGIESMSVEDRETKRGLISKQLSEYNKGVDSARIEELLSVAESTGMTDFWMQYLEKPCVVGMAAVATKTGELEIRDVERYIRFNSLEHTWIKRAKQNKSLYRSCSVYRMVEYFTDNLTRHIAGKCSPSDDKTRTVSVPAFQYNRTNNADRSTNAADRKTLDFSKSNRQALADQMDAIAQNAFPEGFCTHLRKSDLDIMIQYHTNNKARKAMCNGETDVLENFFEVVRRKLLNQTIELSSRAACHKVK